MGFIEKSFEDEAEHNIGENKKAELIAETSEQIDLVIQFLDLCFAEISPVLQGTVLGMGEPSQYNGNCVIKLIRMLRITVTPTLAPNFASLLVGSRGSLSYGALDEGIQIF